METIREFAPGDRYYYDFKLCTTSKGFAQVDTSQDASYFGTWANPFKLMIVNYCEGDVTIQTAETPEEFAKELYNIRYWNNENGHRFIGIDPGFNESLKKEFIKIGLSDMLH